VTSQSAGLGSSTRLFHEGVVPAGVVHGEYIRVLYEQGILSALYGSWRSNRQRNISGIHGQEGART
jgi:hypothetical protein